MQNLANARISNRKSGAGGITVVEKANYEEINKKYWSSRAVSYDRGFSFLRYFQKKAIQLANPQGDFKLLDIGCGPGHALIYAANIDKEGKFDGIDLSPNMLEIARKAATGLTNVQFYEASAEKLPFDADFFDAAICTNSFHHHGNPLQTLKEANRVLKPKGRIYIIDPTSDGFFMRILDKISRKLESGHVKMYSTKEYEAMFTQVGFRYVMSKSILSAEKAHIGEK